MKRSSDDRRNEEPYAECLRGQATGQGLGCHAAGLHISPFYFLGASHSVATAALPSSSDLRGSWDRIVDHGLCGCGALGPFGHTLGTFGALGVKSKERFQAMVGIASHDPRILGRLTQRKDRVAISDHCANGCKSAQRAAHDGAAPLREKDMAKDWAADVKKYASNADEKVIAGIVRYCGIALQKRDSSLVSFADKEEVARVRTNFLRKKLGLTNS